MIHIFYDSGKVDTQCMNREGKSPLYIAAEEGHTEIVKELISSGADVNFSCKTHNHQTPLMIAASNELRPAVVALLKVSH